MKRATFSHDLPELEQPAVAYMVNRDNYTPQHASGSVAEVLADARQEDGRPVDADTVVSVMVADLDTCYGFRRAGAGWSLEWVGSQFCAADLLTDWGIVVES